MPRTTRPRTPGDAPRSIETKPAYLRPLPRPAATVATVHILAPRAADLATVTSSHPTAA